MKNNFKCKCLPFLYQRLSITHLMNGTWKSASHRSLTQTTQPYGLHREFYTLKDNDLESCADENSWIPVKYRRRHNFRYRWY